MLPKFHSLVRTVSRRIYMLLQKRTLPVRPRYFLTGCGDIHLSAMIWGLQVEKQVMSVGGKEEELVTRPRHLTRPLWFLIWDHPHLFGNFLNAHFTLLKYSNSFRFSSRFLVVNIPFTFPHLFYFTKCMFVYFLPSFPILLFQIKNTAL